MTRLLGGILAVGMAWAGVSLPAPLARAAEAGAEEGRTVTSVFLDAVTVARGYTLASGDNSIRLGMLPHVLSTASRVSLQTVDPVPLQANLPAGHRLVGSAYVFDIAERSAYAGGEPLWLEMAYAPADPSARTLPQRHRIYFYDSVSKTWQELPSEDRPSARTVRAPIHLPYAVIAVFEDVILESGKASWYGYRNCLCAASPDYPKGSYLVVSRTDDPTRAVTVLVNDYGPDRNVHPERAIDLDRVAFEKLASLGAGVLNVRVQLLQ
ncbi:RlpA-like double-psi beta-barrel domain-containing protein [Candidatus Uhrbacteria bacterium]|nr:RlpA-like double-psi beta-barrel domain-containing protein [Candidatus Uhrbacteria bacterium]